MDELVILLASATKAQSYAVEAVIMARRARDTEVIVVPTHRLTSIIRCVQNPMIRSVAGQAICEVIAGLAVIGAVWAEGLQKTLGKLRQAHVKAGVVPTEVILRATAHAVSLVFASFALSRTGSTNRNVTLVIASNGYASFSGIV